MHIWTLVPLITCVIYLTLAFLAIPSLKKRINRLFALYLLVAAFWSFTSFMLHFNLFPQSSLVWNELLTIALVWTLISYYHFIRVYAGGGKASRSVWLGYALVGVLAVLALKGYIVEYSYVQDGVLYHSLGISIYFIGAVSLTFISAVLFQLIKKYRSSIDPTDRNRTIYLIAGWCILVVASYTNLIPAIAGIPLDHVGSLANALIISYAVSRFNLLDIKLVLRKGLAYGILIGALTILYVGLVLLGSRFFPDQPTYTVILFATLLALVITILASPLRFVIQESVDRFFYKDTYESRQMLIRFSSRMGNIINLNELADALLPTIVKALRIKQAKLLLEDITSNDFTAQFAVPKPKLDDNDEPMRMGIDSPVLAWLRKESRVLDLKQLDNIPQFKGLWQSEKTALTKSDLELLCPIKSHGKLIGVLALGKKHANGLYSNEDIELVMGMASQAGIIIENAQLFAQAVAWANTDGLTKLYNHRHFHERLEQEIARGSRFGTIFSLILIDVDLFKAYNDTYGHLAGDEVLRKIGRCVETSIRKIDMGFRYGGEEFAVILPETRLEDAYKVAERIRKTIESNASTAIVPITASLGIATWPIDGMMKEEIIARADEALYNAKQTGRNRTCMSTDVTKSEAPVLDVGLEAKAGALSITYALAATVDAKDHHTYGHSRKVSHYAVALAEAINLPQDKISTVRAAGLLHDIGKIGIPDPILNKAGPLTGEEWESVKAHPKLGVEILRHVLDLMNCLPAIAHHHEHLDGRGYPDGLKGSDIPLEARILSIADAYDAMTSARAYREQLSPQQALEELRRCAGTQFDPELVATFCHTIEQTLPKKLEIRQ